MLNRIGGALLLATIPLCGQHILYNQKQDQTAQDAVTAAKAITSGSVFDTMLRNVDLQARQETDTVLAYTRAIMRANIVALDDWKSLADQLDQLENTLKATSPLDPDDGTSPEEKLKVIQAKERALQNAVSQLQSPKVTDPAVLDFLAHLGDARDLVGYAKQIQALEKNQKTGAALNSISAGLDEAISLYNVAKDIWESNAQIGVDPASLRPSQQLIDLQLLQLDEQSIKNMTRIRAAKHLEIGGILAQIGDARRFLGSLLQSSEKIDKTLEDDAKAPGIDSRRKLKLELLGQLEAAAALASNDSAVRLSDTRIGQEARRQSIRRSLVNSSTYDQTIQAAVQRLAAYYKSGIKPADLATLAFLLSNAVSVPVIAAK